MRVGLAGVCGTINWVGGGGNITITEGSSVPETDEGMVNLTGLRGGGFSTADGGFPSWVFWRGTARPWALT